MGQDLFDKYSLAHITSGMIAYKLGFNISGWILANIAFEYIENLPENREWINNNKFWIGPKTSSDSKKNRLGDITSGIIGFYLLQ